MLLFIYLGIVAFLIVIGIFLLIHENNSNLRNNRNKHSAINSSTIEKKNIDPRATIIAKLLTEYWHKPDRSKYTLEEKKFVEHLDYIFHVKPRKKQSIQKRISNGEGLLYIINEIYEEASEIIRIILLTNVRHQLIPSEMEKSFMSFEMYCFYLSMVYSELCYQDNHITRANHFVTGSVFFLDKSIYDFLQLEYNEILDLITIRINYYLSFFRKISEQDIQDETIIMMKLLAAINSPIKLDIDSHKLTSSINFIENQYEYISPETFGKLYGVFSKKIIDDVKIFSQLHFENNMD